MRLKQHREDVKDLRMMSDPHVQDIARRYIRLIQMAEETFEYWDVPDTDKKALRVLKDAVKEE